MNTQTPSNVYDLFISTNELSQADTNDTGIITPQKLLYFICSKTKTPIGQQIPAKKLSAIVKRFLATVKNDLQNPLISSAVNSFIVLEFNKEAEESETPSEVGRRMKMFAAALHKFLVDLDTALVEGDYEQVSVCLEALDKFQGSIDGYLPVKIQLSTAAEQEDSTDIVNSDTHAELFSEAVASGQVH